MINFQRSETTKSWDQEAPREAPFQASPTFSGLRMSGPLATYTVADTWYPTWAADDDLYTPFTDGCVFGLKVMSLGEEASTGHARIQGDDPLDLHIDRVGAMLGSPAPYGGRYPGGSLAHNGAWYYSTYCLDETDRGLNWDILGPMVGFRVSTDGGQNWTETSRTPSEPLFGESGHSDVPVKMGAPHFVDFGRNMEHSPDGYAYLVGHGSMTSKTNLSWISGDDIFLARTIPSAETIDDADAWQFFGGRSDEADVWVADIRDARPIASWPGHMGCVTVTYHAPSGKYLMCITDGWPTIKEMTSYILECDSLTGVWKMVAYMPSFGKQAYFLNFPSKFISEDGTSLWLSYSANFTNGYLKTSIEPDPMGSRYAMCLLQLELIGAKA